MNKLAIFFLITLSHINVNAQKSDTTTLRSKNINYGFTEHFTELNNKKGVKNGYAEVREGNKIIASGSYNNNKKIGRWRFFKKDTLEQIYNYSTSKIEYISSDKDISYQIDSLKEGDKIVYPSKIGGNYFGLRFLVTTYIIPMQLYKNYGEYPIYFIFKLNEYGKVLSIKAKTIVAKKEYDQNIDLSKLTEEQLQFKPAKVNGKGVASTLIFKGNVKI